MTEKTVFYQSTCTCFNCQNCCQKRKSTKKYLSPINILTDNTKKLCLPPLTFSTNHWDPYDQYEANNTGKYVEFHRKPNETPLVLYGGPLNGYYIFNSLHSHWDPSSDVIGTEHSFNSIKYAMEFHAVYVNSKYSSLEEGMKKPDGVAVCAFVIRTDRGGYVNPDFDALSEAACRVQAAGSTSTCRGNPLVALRTAIGQRFFHYSGTLTGETPAPVTWIIFKPTILVANQQLRPFRKLLDYKGKIVQNIREAVPFDRTPVVYNIDRFCMSPDDQQCLELDNDIF